jgi:integrase
MTGTVIRVPGLKQFRHKKNGKVYTYHRATGKRLLSEPGTPAFLTELAALETEVRALAEEAAKPNTLGALIKSYKTTEAWTDLAPRTKQDYEKVIAYFAPLYDAPILLFTPPHIVALRDQWLKERGRRFVNYCRTVLILLMNRAVEQGLLPNNPAQAVRKIKRDKSLAPLNRPWSEAEQLAVWQRTAAARYRHLRLPLAIGLYTGMREADMINLPRTMGRDGRVDIETAKRKVRIDLRILPELAVAMAEAPAHDSLKLCANMRGKPWTQDGFRTSFFKMIKDLEREGAVESGLTYHGLRHTVASRLAERGVSLEDIAAVLGQKSSKVAQIYTERADRSRRADAVITKLRPTEK